MIFPKPLFQKLLDAEISPEEYKNKLLPEAQKRFALFTIINIPAIFYIDQYWTKTGKPQVSFWVGFLLLVGIYIAIAGFFSFIFYRDEKKQSNFLIAILKEDHQKAKKNNPTEKTKVRAPRKEGNLYLKGEISKFEYVYAVFNFRHKLIQGSFLISFVLFFLQFFLLFWKSITSDFFTVIFGSYFAAFMVAFFVRAKIGDLLLLDLGQTLNMKQKQHEAFDHAENTHHS